MHGVHDRSIRDGYAGVVVSGFPGSTALVVGEVIEIDPGAIDVAQDVRITQIGKQVLPVVGNEVAFRAQEDLVVVRAAEVVGEGRIEAEGEEVETVAERGAGAVVGGRAAHPVAVVLSASEGAAGAEEVTDAQAAVAEGVGADPGAAEAADLNIERHGVGTAVGTERIGRRHLYKSAGVVHAVTKAHVGEQDVDQRVDRCRHRRRRERGNPQGQQDGEHGEDQAADPRAGRCLRPASEILDSSSHRRPQLGRCVPP